MEVDDPSRAYCSVCYNDDRTDYVILHDPTQPTVNVAHYCCYECAQRWFQQNDTCPDCRRRIEISDIVRMPPLERRVCSTILVVRDGGRADIRDERTGLGYRWCNGNRMQDSNYCRHHAAPTAAELNEQVAEQVDEAPAPSETSQQPLVVDVEYHRDLRRVMNSSHGHQQARQHFLQAARRYVMVNDGMSSQLVEQANTLNLRSDALQYELQVGGQLTATVLSRQSQDAPTLAQDLPRALSPNESQSIVLQQLRDLDLLP